jgi:hypothetical protein
MQDWIPPDEPKPPADDSPEPPLLTVDEDDNYTKQDRGQKWGHEDDPDEEAQEARSQPSPADPAPLQEDDNGIFPHGQKLLANSSQSHANPIARTNQTPAPAHVDASALHPPNAQDAPPGHNLSLSTSPKVDSEDLNDKNDSLIEEAPTMMDELVGIPLDQPQSSSTTSHPSTNSFTLPSNTNEGAKSNGQPPPQR